MGSDTPKENENASNASEEVVQISSDDAKILLKYYDKDRDGKLTTEEIQSIVSDYNEHKVEDAEVIKVIHKFDKDKDNLLQDHEIKILEKHILSLNETTFRYLGYSAVAARAFRYLAFTSDFGEAVRPVVSARIVTSTYAIAIGYCVADVAYEAYKLKKRGYVTENTREPMSMTQLLVERSTFQAAASIIVPFAVIHTAVDVSKRMLKGTRFAKWGPSIVGLLAIPFLPLCLDHPVESGLEYMFHHYGPWAKKKNKSATTGGVTRDKDKAHKD